MSNNKQLGVFAFIALGVVIGGLMSLPLGFFFDWLIPAPDYMLGMQMVQPRILTVGEKLYVSFISGIVCGAAVFLSIIIRCKMASDDHAAANLLAAWPCICAISVKGNDKGYDVSRGLKIRGHASWMTMWFILWFLARMIWLDSLRLDFLE